MTQIELPHLWNPRAHQLPLWRALEGGVKRAVAVWHRRCIAEGTAVIMADGSWLPIEDVKPGDRVKVWVDGEYLDDVVTDVFCSGDRECVEVSARGFQSIEATPDHEFMVATGGKGFRFQQIGTVRALNLIDSGRPDQATFYAGHDFTGRSIPDLARLAGYLVADGSVHAAQQPKFTNNSIPVLREVERLAGLLFGVKAIWREKGNGYDLGLSNGTKGGGTFPNPVKEFMREQGALGLKRDRRIPRVMWAADEESAWAFMSAVVDSDGTIEVRQNPTGSYPHATMKIHAGQSRELAMDYYWLLAKLGVRVSSVKIRGGSCWTLLVGEHEQTRKACSRMTLLHEGKAALAQQILDGPAGAARIMVQGADVASVRIKPAGIRRTWDITTQNHHRFIANGYVVHNCGKDSVSLNWTACEALEHPGVYWHMAPTQRQVRKLLWNGIDKEGRRIMKQAFPDAIVKRRRDDEMLTEFVNGSIHQCVGSDNFDSLVGSNPRGVVFSEWSLANPRAWDFIRPILVENGGWAIFIYTPRGRNHGLRLLELAKTQPGWFAQVLTVEETGLVSMDLIEQERRELVIQHGEEWADSIHRQEWYCDFDAPVLGTYYAKRIAELDKQGRIGVFPHDPSRPVHTAWDIGINDAMVVWFFQVIGSKVRIIDYMEGSGHGLSWYVNRLTGLAKWGEDNLEMKVPVPVEGLERRGAYRFGTHYGPHDAANSEVGTGRRRVDVLFDMGVRMHVLPRLNVADGISAVRQFVLADCEFNVPPGAPIDDPMSVSRGLDGLRNYRRKWSDERQCFVDTPFHDWCSNPADALRYAALGLQMEPPVSIDVPYEPPFGSMEWIEAQERAAQDVEDADHEYYR